ncbi:hypothetical protein RMATCC62417_11497 [Rhizopus microsporus]|nr:hypothetical protein RMATCC62417_11497 [Rhizopus microsporus]
MNHAPIYGLWHPQLHSAAGADINDIVTLGNWSSSTAFDHHYHCERLSLVDFTNTVLPVPADDDVFHDAEFNFD